MATFAILIWLVLAPVAFARLPAVSAIILAVVVPYLFLPEAFAIELPGLPDIDKTAVISIGLLMGFFLFRDKFRQARNDMPTILAGRGFRVLILCCFWLLGFGLILSIMSNRETLVFGPRVIQGLRPWDGISLLSTLTLFILPFLFARHYLGTPQAHRALLWAFAVAGLGYTLLMLIEIRLSPQLHNWVYGFHQHSFAQHVRSGYRPKVFLQHGLWVGFFMFMAIISSIALWKIEKNAKWLFAGLWLIVIIFLSRNLGATGIALLMLGLFVGLWPYMQIRVVAIIAICVLVFPALRQAQFIPTAQIINMAASISEDRADSLQFRFENEDALLERALLKPVAGWGPYAREQIYRPSDGKVLSITEGRWTQVLGVQGWIGYIGLFGLLTFPLIFLKYARSRKEVPPETIALALIAAGNLIYMIPNSTLTPIGWLVFGALAGFVQFDSTAKTEKTAAQPAPRDLKYTRFPPKEAGSGTREPVKSPKRRAPRNA